MDNGLIKFIDVIKAFVDKGDGIYPNDATKILAEAISRIEAMQLGRGHCCSRRFSSALPEWPFGQFEQAMAHFKDVPWVKSAFHEAGWAMKGDGDDV